MTRRVGRNGLINFAAAHYRAGIWLAGENVSVICDGGLVQLEHRGVLVATHARKHPIDKQGAGLRRGVRPSRPRRPRATAVSVTRKVDSSGNVCFAGGSYRAGSKLRRRQVQVTVIEETVEISIGSENRFIAAAAEHDLMVAEELDAIFGEQMGWPFSIYRMVAFDLPEEQWPIQLDAAMVSGRWRRKLTG